MSSAVVLSSLLPAMVPSSTSSAMSARPLFSAVAQSSTSFTVTVAPSQCSPHLSLFNVLCLGSHSSGVNVFVPRELTFELTRFRYVAGFAGLTRTQQTHCDMQASVFSHTRTTTRAGSLVHVRVETVAISTRGKHADLPIISSSFLNGYRRQRVI